MARRRTQRGNRGNPVGPYSRPPRRNTQPRRLPQAGGRRNHHQSTLKRMCNSGQLTDCFDRGNGILGSYTYGVPPHGPDPPIY